jgi:hypothetical protein
MEGNALSIRGKTLPVKPLYKLDERKREGKRRQIGNALSCPLQTSTSWHPHQCFPAREPSSLHSQEAGRIPSVDGCTKAEIMRYWS